MNELDFTKPVQTRDGRKVRVLAIGRDLGEKAVVGMIGCELCFCGLDGAVFGYNGILSGDDLVQAEEHPSQSIADRICAEIQLRAEAGLKKYGMPLDDNPAAILERLQHIKEELMDAIGYIQWAQDKLGR